jgi:hypothetical protein
MCIGSFKILKFQWIDTFEYSVASAEQEAFDLVVNGFNPHVERYLE